MTCNILSRLDIVQRPRIRFNRRPVIIFPADSEKFVALHASLHKQLFGGGRARDNESLRLEGERNHLGVLSWSPAE